MTKSAIEIAIEALRECASEDFKGPPGISIYAAAASELPRRAKIAREALAALTTEPIASSVARITEKLDALEPVPPDRAALAERLMAAAAEASPFGENLVETALQQGDLEDAYLLLRQPAPAEVSVEDVAQALVGDGFGGWHSDETREYFHAMAARAVALLRRIVLPAVGDWRPIASAPKDGTPILVWPPHYIGAWEDRYSDMLRGHKRAWWANGMQIELTPTLWMPLHTPPVPDEEPGE